LLGNSLKRLVTHAAAENDFLRLLACLRLALNSAMPARNSRMPTFADFMMHSPWVEIENLQIYVSQVDEERPFEIAACTGSNPFLLIGCMDVRQPGHTPTP
jgi:hypothetical protein